MINDLLFPLLTNCSSYTCTSWFLFGFQKNHKYKPHVTKQKITKGIPSLGNIAHFKLDINQLILDKFLMFDDTLISL